MMNYGEIRFQQARKKYLIRGTVEKIYSENRQEFLDYIASGKLTDKKLMTEFEYAYTYFLALYF